MRRAWGALRRKKATEAFFINKRANSAATAAPKTKAISSERSDDAADAGLPSAGAPAEARPRGFRHGSHFNTIEVGGKAQRWGRISEHDKTRRAAIDGHALFNDPTSVEDPIQLQQSLPLPSKSEVPYRNRWTLKTLQQCAAKLGLDEQALDVKSQCQGGGVHVCRISWGSSEETRLTATGRSYTKLKAEEGASLRLLSKLYVNGILDPLTPDTATSTPKLQGAKLNVYDYAASYQCPPDISTTRTSNGYSDSYTCTIEMPEHGLKTKATAGSRLTAELSACVKFHKLSRILQVHDRQSTRRVEDGAIGLNYYNASEFVAFYKAAYPRYRLGINVKEHTTKEWEASVYIEGHCIQDGVLASSNSQVMQLASVVLSIYLLKEKPWAWKQFSENFNPSSSDTRLPLSGGHGIQLRGALVRAKAAGLDDLPIALSVDHEQLPTRLPFFAKSESQASMEQRSRYLYEQFSKQEAQPTRKQYLKSRRKLAIGQQATRVSKLVNDHDVSVVSASLGSGKTSLIPQLLFEQEISNKRGGSFKILCVLRSRRSAVSTARLVANQRNEEVGFTVGYETEKVTTLPECASGAIIYTSSSYLTHQLHQNKSRILDSFSHIMVDDAEYDVPGTEIMLTVLKDALRDRETRGRSACKIILAHSGLRINTDSLVSYFASEQVLEGRRTFGEVDIRAEVPPVPRYYLEDICDVLGKRYESSQLEIQQLDHHYIQLERDFARQNQPAAVEDIARAFNLSSGLDLDVQENVGQGIARLEPEVLVPLRLGALVIAHLVKTTSSGAILVFLPGMIYISKLQQILAGKSPLGVPFGDEKLFDLVILDSYSTRHARVRLPSSKLQGQRKIVFSTSMVDYAASLPDLRFVVDFGKEMQHISGDGSTSLATAWTSKHNIEKRMERADTSGQGQYIAMFTRSRAASLPQTRDTSIYQELPKKCLLAKSSHFSGTLFEFFRATPIPPAPELVMRAVSELVEIDALTEGSAELTTLGRLLSLLSTDPSTARSIILGIVFRCYEPLQVIGAGMKSRHLFDRVEEKTGKQKLNFARHSDHLAIYTAFDEVRAVRTLKGGISASHHTHRMRGVTILSERFISMDNRARRMEQALVDAGVIAPSFNPEYGIGSDDLNANANSHRLLIALLLSGAPHNIAIPSSRNRYQTAFRDGCLISGGSVVQSNKVSSPELVFFSRSSPTADGTSLVLHQVSQISPMAVLLFGAGLKMTGPHTFEIGGWLEFHLVDTPVTVLHAIIEFRAGLHGMINLAINELRGGATPQGQHIRHIFTETLLKALSWNFGRLQVLAKPRTDVDTGSTETQVS